MESPMTYDVENPGPGLEQVQLCGGVKPVIFVMCSKGYLEPSTFLSILFHWNRKYLIFLINQWWCVLLKLMKYNCTIQTAQLQVMDRFIHTLPFELCSWLKKLLSQWNEEHQYKMVPKDTKTVTRNRISKKNIYYNDQKNMVKWTNNDVQNTTQKIKQFHVNLIYDYKDISLIDHIRFRRVCL